MAHEPDAVELETRWQRLISLLATEAAHREYGGPTTNAGILDEAGTAELRSKREGAINV